jgi:RNA polymerase sigma factor (sigma-70 family)
MPQVPISDAIAELCMRTVTGIESVPDGELLRRYVDARDEAAFAALLRRHGRVVWGAAMRRTADRHAAEDVFQATFLALARRADRLHSATSLSGWLYTVGVRLARRAARRTKPAALEHDVADQQPNPLTGLSARELLAAVDDELARLPEPLRLPVVLCCLDGLSRDEAAIRLGCSFGSLKGRLERGRELLRQRLERRGMSLPALFGGLMVLPAAVPSDVVAGAIKVVLGGVPRPAAKALASAIPSSRIAGLMSLATAIVIGVGLTLLPAGAPPGAEPKAPAKSPDAEPAVETLTVQVFRDGKPAVGAKVWAAAPSQPKKMNGDEPKPAVTGPDGLVGIPIADGLPMRLFLFARDSDGQIGAFDLLAHQPPLVGPPTIHLLPVGELGGRIRTPDGKPLGGIELRVEKFNRRDEARDPRQPSYLNVPSSLQAEYTAKTDADGRFRIPGAPIGYQGYAMVTTVGFGQGVLQAEAGQPADVTLSPAGAVRIRLTGPGEPAGTKGMTVSLNTAGPPGQRAAFIPRASVILDGSAEFRVPNLSPGRYQVRVFPAPRFPARLTSAAEIVVASGTTVDLAATVEPLGRVTGRVIDADTGKGIPKAPIYLQTRAADGRPVSFGGTVETDAEGRFEGYGPAGEWALLSIQSPVDGYAPPTQAALKAVSQGKLDLAKPHVFPDLKLRPAATLRVAVVDDLGQPVAAPVVRPARISPYGFGRESLTGKPDGTFVLTGLGPDDVIAPRVRKGDAVNVPTPVEIAKQDTKITIAVSEKNACRIRGRVTDEAGKPLAGSKVVVMWQYSGLGATATMSTTRGVEALTTDADGRYASSVLWPTDIYHVSITRDGHGEAQSKQVRGEAGQVHELGTTQLVRIGQPIHGKVVGTDGTPLAGVTVFQRDDGPVPTTAKTGPDGSFALAGLFDRTGFVLARHDGYRLAAIAVQPGGDAVTIRLRKATEAPPPVPVADGKEAALTAFTRSLLEMLWADREHLGGYERNVFRNMARFDPATAKRWLDDEKKRTNGKTDLPRLLLEADLEQNLLTLARADLDETLSRMPKSDRWDVNRVVALARQLLPVDKAKALRAAEEAAVRARALDAAERPWGLAGAGDVAIQAGNAAGGKKLLAEAVELAAKLPDDKNYYRGWVAAAVVAHDEPAAFRLIDGITDADQFNGALGEMIKRLATIDPKRAESLLVKFRPGRDSSPSVARLALGFRLAAADPEKAESIINTTPEAMYRLLGLARLATLVAAHDRKRAWRLIDRAMDAIDSDPDSLRGWSNYGGLATIAAVVAARGRQVGHPDVGGLVARVLAHRASGHSGDSRKYREDRTISLAIALGFADSSTARVLLASIAPADEFARRAPRETRDWLIAAAVVDPKLAGAVVASVWNAAKQRRGGGEAVSQTGLIELLSALTDRGDRLTNVGSYGRIPTIPNSTE